jgi:hypothetical protein
MKEPKLDLKYIFQKIEYIFNSQNIKEKNDFEPQEEKIKKICDQVFEILYPYLIIFCKSNGVKDDDLINDFALYFYEKLSYIVKHFDPEKSSITTYIILVIKSKFKEFLRLNKNNNFLLEYRDNISYDKNSSIDYDYYQNNFETENDFNEIDVKQKNIYDTIDNEIINDKNRYRDMIYNFINKLDDIDKVIFYLYYYELIDEEILKKLSIILNITTIDLLKILNDFRNLNNSKYENFETLKIKLNKTIEKTKKEEIYNKLTRYNITGDIQTISKIINLSENAIRIKLSRLRDKFHETYKDYKNF